MRMRAWVVGLAGLGIGLAAGGLAVYLLNGPRQAAIPSGPSADRPPPTTEPGPDPSPGVAPTDPRPGELLSCLGSSAQAKTFEAVHGGQFAWGLIQDTNDYQGAPARGYKLAGSGMLAGRLTFACAGPRLVLFNGPPGNGLRVETPVEPQYDRYDYAAVKFFDRPLAPAYGRPFVLAQLVVVVRGSDPGTDVSEYQIGDPFDELRPLPPVEGAGKRIRRYTLHCMAVDPAWLPAKGTGVPTQRSKEVEAFFADLGRPWGVGGAAR